ncbi:Recombinase [Caballeronia calidae]|uniref:Recombinase n=1 Tax=Caballeronia calidae TaxID=1777139 RepID=A0A158B850_9BURK|nr:recombinase family protein [Caballeronia calidae]SAK66275.1 Recombinase [Caballeronia calidae]
MRRASIYARYSDQEQRPTSIDDQLRRTKQKAEELGFTVADEHIYVDAAITGQGRELAKRAAYSRLIHAWEKGEFEAIIVDEVARLARASLEFAHLEQRIERTRVRLVSCDGVDTLNPGWQLQFGIFGLMAAHFVRETSHRVVRGMQGQLERGFMIAKAPFGYRAMKMGDKDNEGGTVWEVDQERAKWVKEIFQMRFQGRSLNTIAERLNREGVACPRSPRGEGKGYWRPATVHQMLANTIYRGVFVYHGSAYSTAKAKREKRTLKPVEYQRPELRIVEDRVWHSCNTPTGSRPFCGGGRHVLAGLATCGVCGGTMSFRTGGSSPALHCSKCAQQRRVGKPNAPTQVSYVAAEALQRALLQILRRFLFDDERVQEFRRRLEVSLFGRHELRIEELRSAVGHAERQLDSLAQRMRRLEPGNEEFLERAYREQQEERKHLLDELTQLTAYSASLNGERIRQPVEVNPLDFVSMLFTGGAPAELTRAVLSRVFPSIVLSKRPARFISVWKIVACAGATVARLDGAFAGLEGKVAFTVQVETGAARPTAWHVTVLEASVQ